MVYQLKKGLNSYSGWLIIIIISLVPVLFLFQNTSWIEITATQYSVFSFLGRVSSLVGLVLFSINFILSTRHSILEKFFYGLNKVYVAHHLVGGISFIFLLLHPLFLSLRFIPDDWYQAATILIPSVTQPIDWPLNFGIIAIYGMIILLVVTFFVKLHYELWLWTHKLLGFVFFIGIMHSFLIPSDIATDPLLRAYMLIISLVGLLAFVYTSLMGTFVIKKYPYLVEKVAMLYEDVVELTLKPIRHIMPYRAGQFVFVRFFQSGIPTQRHPFSVSSIVSKDEKQQLTITVKKLGDFTNEIIHLKKDTEVEVEGAFGKFSYRHARYQKQIWIAGGIGITPFLSMANDLTDDGYIVNLYYSVKTRNELIGIDNLNEVAKKDDVSFKVFPYVADEQDGYLSADFIADHVGDISKTDIFICGPPGMMAALRQQFRKKGIPNNLIHSEEFSID